MEAAKSTPPRRLAREFAVFIVAGWFPFVAVCAGVARFLGGIHELVLLFLYFFGGGFMLYLAAKTLSAAKPGGRALNFDWKAMTVLVWGNPKAWLSIPAGSLAADYSESEAANILFFIVLNLPAQISAAAWWAFVARQGVKIAGDRRMGYANAFMLAGFAAYLLWRGGELAAS